MKADPVSGEILVPFTPGAGLGREGVLTSFYGNPRQVWLSLGVKF